MDDGVEPEGRSDAEGIGGDQVDRIDAGPVIGMDRVLRRGGVAVAEIPLPGYGVADGVGEGDVERRTAELRHGRSTCGRRRHAARIRRTEYQRRRVVKEGTQPVGNGQRDVVVARIGIGMARILQRTAGRITEIPQPPAGIDGVGVEIHRHREGIAHGHTVEVGAEWCEVDAVAFHRAVGAAGGGGDDQGYGMIPGQGVGVCRVLQRRRGAVAELPVPGHGAGR
jgi:hypothetical protein